MPRLDPKNVVKRSDQAWTEKAGWRSVRESAYELALPMRNPYSGTGEFKRKVSGERKMNRVFDSTLMVATTRFAARLQSDLLPPFQRWGKLIPGAFIPQNAKAEVGKRLDGLTDVLFAAIHTSNFDLAVGEMLLDLAIGTGCLLVIPGDDETPVRYVAAPQAQCALEEGPWGGINGVYRKHEIRMRLIEETYEAFDVKLPEGWEKKAEKDPEKEVRVVEATYFDAKEDQWFYDVIIEGNGQRGSRGTDPERIVEHTFAESPWVIARWIKVAGEVEGRGPVLAALPDAKTLNKLKELVLMNASIAVAGVWTAVDDGILNPYTIRIIPGAVIPVGRNGGALGASLQPLQSGGRFDVASLVAEDLIMSIKTIMMDSALPREEGPVRSATEIIARLKQLQADVGAPFGRLMSELVRPVIQKTLNVLAEKKIIALEPGQRIKVNGGTVDVQLQSPLALSQNLSDVETAAQWMAIVQGMGPEAFALGVNIEDAPEWFAEKMGVDMRLPRTAEQRKALQQMIGAMAAQNGGTMAAGGGGGQPAQANDTPGLLAPAA